MSPQRPDTSAQSERSPRTYPPQTSGQQDPAVEVRTGRGAQAGDCVVCGHPGLDVQLAAGDSIYPTQTFGRFSVRTTCLGNDTPRCLFSLTSGYVRLTDRRGRCEVVPILLREIQPAFTGRQRTCANHSAGLSRLAKQKPGGYR